MEKDLDTIFAIRLSEDRAAFWRQILQVIVILASMFAGFALFAGVQFWTCYLRNSDVGFVECFRGFKEVKKRG